MAKRNSKTAAEKVDLSRKKTKEFDVDTNIKVAYKTGNIMYGKNQILKKIQNGRSRKK